MINGDEIRRIHEILARIISAAELVELDQPHIVVCRDEATGSVSYSGPFTDGLAALEFAERERAVDVELNEGDPLSFSVAALYPTGRVGTG
ncbi:hypothetical protein EFK50_14630 [Nocardioides marmoriginsengisoli]|uniref:Uncharacterized protein n=1 Tax=Nocardioides marmoriginsengisoli TaxID=661483 RepID=A0A3N0CHM5_9ACTN|nr:hypothetical protein [Nocardioides marmoriginsengisoli]RNL62957.1 hypothetical protein EFK50_14630 [Nocardioides marmoriginsengisoli]